MNLKSERDDYLMISGGYFYIYLLALVNITVTFSTMIYWISREFVFKIALIRTMKSVQLYQLMYRSPHKLEKC